MGIVRICFIFMVSLLMANISLQASSPNSCDIFGYAHEDNVEGLKKCIEKEKVNINSMDKS